MCIRDRTNLEVGASYKLQLLFAEQQWPRGFDVYIDGGLVVDDFSPAFYQGGGFPLVLPSPDDRGVVITHTFVARKTDVTVRRMPGKRNISATWHKPLRRIRTAMVFLIPRSLRMEPIRRSRTATTMD